MFSFLLLVLLASVVPSAFGECLDSTRLVRKEWRQLTSIEQQEYITAERCLQSLPGKTGLPGAVTRFDDLQAVHQAQSLIIHNVGQFLPFHRLFVWLHEELLREECGYTGAQPWWNETMDDGHYSDSLLFKSDAFGGDGTGELSCVPDGPFANYTLHLGPGFSVTNHCLQRHITNPLGSGAFFVDLVFGAKNYDDLQTFMTRVPSPHTAGHSAVGGEMADFSSSPGDPVFYLHHAWIDRLWSIWQARDPKTRLTEVTGFTTITPPFTEVTLDYELNLFGIRPNATIREVMDIVGDRICVGYDS